MVILYRKELFHYIQFIFDSLIYNLDIQRILLKDNDKGTGR